MKKLPVWATAKTAVAFVFANLWPMALVCIPWVVIGAVGIIGLTMIGDRLGMFDPSVWKVGEISVGFFVAVAVGIVLVAIGATAIYIAWHRMILLGEPARLTSALTFDRKLWRYLGVYVLFGVLALVPVTVGIAGAYLALPSREFAVAIGVLGAVLFVAVVVAEIRWSFVFPAIAIGEPSFGLGGSWWATTGNGWRLFGVFVLTALVAVAISFVEQILLLFTGAMGGLVATILDIGFQVVVDLITSALLLAALTFAYGYLVKDQPLR